MVDLFGKAGDSMELRHIRYFKAVAEEKNFTDLIRKPRPFRGDFAMWLEILYAIARVCFICCARKPKMCIVNFQQIYD